MSTTIPIETRILRQLDENLRAALRLREPWYVHHALIVGAAAVLESIEQATEWRFTP